MDAHRLPAMDQDQICLNVLKGFAFHNCKCSNELAACMAAVCERIHGKQSEAMQPLSKELLPFMGEMSDCVFIISLACPYYLKLCFYQETGETVNISY